MSWRQAGKALWVGSLGEHSAPGCEWSVWCEVEGVIGVGKWWLDSGHIGGVGSVLGAVVTGRYYLRVDYVNGDAIIVEGWRL